MPPKGKDSKKAKQGTSLKELIPATLKQAPRDPKPVKAGEFVQISHKVNEYTPQQLPEDWPGDDPATNFDFGIENTSGKGFQGDNKFPLPPSMKQSSKAVVFWRRPRELLRYEAGDGGSSFSGSGAGSGARSLKRKNTMNEYHERRRSTFNHQDDMDYTGSPLHQADDIQVELFQIFEREETAEEMEKRKQEAEQTTKTKKKATKKEEPQDGPLKIKEVKLTNIDLSHEVPPYSKWIASQLQMIKDKDIRDANTSKPMWAKVYPQKNGVPVYNPNGRYWVKLYYMGKERKIEIDDRIPVVYNQSLLPKSVNRNEIWPSILTKAILKLNSPRWSDPKAKEIEVGDGSIVYAFTGYIPETVSLNNQFFDKFKFLASALSDDNHKNGETYISAYCMPDHQPKAPSNKIKNIKELIVNDPKQLIQNRKQSDDTTPSTRRAKGSFTIKMKQPQTFLDLDAHIHPHDDEDEEEKFEEAKSPQLKIDPFREKPTNIIPGFAYSIFDIFENEQFNMVYVLKRTEQDIKLRQDYLNMQKMNVNKFTREQKVEFRKQKKELKDRIHEEDKKRIELISKPAIQYKLLRIKSNISKVPSPNITCPFDSNDINLAKKCILNKLSRPPNYDYYDVKVDDSKSVSTTTHMQSMSGMELGKLQPLDDFSRLDSVKEPQQRGKGGSWMTDKDFVSCFQYVQVFHNPKKFKHSTSHTFQSVEELELVNYEDKEVLVVDSVPDNQEEEKGSELIPVVPTPHYLLYQFGALRAVDQFIIPKPFSVLQKYNFSNFEAVANYKTMQEVLDSDMLQIENKYQVFRINTVSPVTFQYGFYSTLPITLMSVGEYLCKFENYQQKTLTVDYNNIDKDKYMVVFKGSISELEEDQNILVKVSGNDLAFLRFLRLKVIELKDKDYVSNEEFKTGVVDRNEERSYVLTNLIKIHLEAGKKYLFIIEGTTPFVCQDGSFDLNLFCKNENFELQSMDLIDPVEYVDKYQPTKYGILFRERLFVNHEVQGSFHVRCCLMQSNQSIQQPAKGKKGQEMQQFEEVELPAQRLIKFELFREDKLVAYAFGYNQVLMSNVTLYPTNDKEEPRNYYLQASFDLRDWPEAKEVTDENKSICWILRTCGNDTIGILRDTQKEEAQKAIKKSWEDNEPGRAEKAKKARRKYFIQEKKLRGEQLDAEEIEILNEPRVRKSKEEENKKDAKKGSKAKPPPKKDPKKDKKGETQETQPEEQKVQRELPKAENHVTGEICKFLSHLEQPRTLQETDDTDGDVRSESNISEHIEKLQHGKEEVYGMHQRNVKVREEFKELLQNKKHDIDKAIHAIREEQKTKHQDLQKERENIRATMKKKKENEKNLFEMCKAEKANFEELEKIIQDPTFEEFDINLQKLAKKVRKASFIAHKIEKITTAVTMYDLPTIVSTLEEIKEHSIEVDPEVIAKAEEIQEEAKKNPNYITEKQKEVAKAMKGKKK